jgi:hypothetical protein
MSSWESLNNSEKSRRLRHLTVGEKYTFQQLTPTGERIFYRNGEYLGMGPLHPRYGERIDVKMPGRFGRTFKLPLSSLDVNIPPFVPLMAQEIPVDAAAADVPVAAVVPVGAADVPVAAAAAAPAAAAAAPAAAPAGRNWLYVGNDMISEVPFVADAPPGMFDISDFLPRRGGGRRRKRKSRKRKSRKRKSRKRKTKRRRKSRKRRS